MFKQLREKSGKTQTTLAKLLSLDQTSVSKWEQGAAIPRVSMIPAIAEALGVSIEEVVLCFAKKGA